MDETDQGDDMKDMRMSDIVALKCLDETRVL